MRVRSIALLSVLLIFYAAVIATTVRRPRLEQRLVFRDPLADPAYLLLADMDGDGNDEVIRCWPTHAVISFLEQATDESRRLVKRAYRDQQINFERSGRLAPVIADVDGDDLPDLFLVSRETRMQPSKDGPHEYFVTCYRPMSEDQSPDLAAYTLGPFLQGCSREIEGSVGTVWVRGVHDLDQDGRPELLLHLYPYKPDCGPRALVAYDGPSGRERWRFEIASPANTTIFLDRIDEVGGRTTDIIVASHACDNGFQVEDMTDSQSYLMSISANGARNWLRVMGGKGVGAIAAVVDVAGDGRQEILAGTHSDGLGRVPEVFLVAPADGSARAIPIPEFPGRLKAVDLDNNGTTEILLVGIDGVLYCLRSDFDVAWRSRTQDSGYVVGVLDLTGDGRLEIVCSGTNALRIYDVGGRELFSHDAIAQNQAPLVEVLVGRFADRPHLVVHAGDAVSVYAMAVMPWHARLPWQTAGAGTFFWGLAALLLSRRHRRYRRQAGAQREAQEQLLKALRSLTHGAGCSSWRDLNRLLTYLKSWNRLEELGGVAGSPVPELIAAYESHVLPDLQRVADKGAAAGVPHSCWRQLVACGEAALDDLRALQPASNGHNRQHAHRARAALEGVQFRLQQIDDYLQAVFRTPVLALVRNVIAHRRPEAEAAGVRIDLVSDPGRDVHVFVSRRALDKALDACLENAIRAVAGCDRKRIEIAIDVRETACEIEVRDTGAGVQLSQDEWDRIFERTYSTRIRTDGDEPGGFGLFYAREELARFGGTISVAFSTPGEGTCLRLALKLSRDPEPATNRKNREALHGRQR